MTGHETFDIVGLTDGIATFFASGRKLKVRATKADGAVTEFDTVVRIVVASALNSFERA